MLPILISLDPTLANRFNVAFVKIKTAANGDCPGLPFTRCEHSSRRAASFALFPHQGGNPRGISRPPHQDRSARGSAGSRPALTTEHGFNAGGSCLNFAAGTEFHRLSVWVGPHAPLSPFADEASPGRSFPVQSSVVLRSAVWPYELERDINCRGIL